MTVTDTDAENVGTPSVDTSEVDVPDTDAHDVDSATTDSARSTNGLVTGWFTRTRLAAAVLAVAIVAASALTSVVYFTQYRPDQRVDSSVSRAALTAAQTGAGAVLSYAPASMQRDFDDAKSRLTGSFLDYYSTFTAQVVAPAVKQNSVASKATVVRGAISDLKPTTATALIFVNQSVTSTDKPDPTLTSSSVKVGLTKVDGHWLISAFDPV